MTPKGNVQLTRNADAACCGGAINSEITILAGMNLLIAKRKCKVVSVSEGKCVVYDSTVDQTFVMEMDMSPDGAFAVCCLI